MSLKSAQLDGYLITEKEMKPLETLILDQYKEADKIISGKLRTLWDKMQNEGVLPADQYNWLIQYDRNIKLKQEITAAYTKYDQSAMNLTAQSGKIGISNNYYRQYFMVNYQEPLSFSVLPAHLIEYATYGQIDAWKSLSDKMKDRFKNPAKWPPNGTLLDVFRKNRGDTLRQIQAVINSNLQAGNGYKVAAKAVSNVVGSISDGKATGQLAKALRIVRTEGNRVLNAGSYASTLTAEDMGIKMARMWDAALDSATRPAHGAADGQDRATDKPFSVGGEALMYPGDSAGSPGNIVNCRCTTVDIVDGWKPTARRGRDPVTKKNKVFDYKTFDQWAKDNGLTKNKYGMLYKEAKA